MLRTPIQFIQLLLEKGDWYMSAIELDHGVDGDALKEEAEEIVTQYYMNYKED